MESMGTSIIITTYNDYDDLPQCIESCLEQNPLEVIVIDDHSERDPAHIVKRYPVKYIRHGKNSKLSAARNTAISTALGEYVVMMDCDDYFLPHALEKMEYFIGDNDIVYGNLIFKDSGVRLIPNKNIKLEDFAVNNQLYTASLYRKSMWEFLGGYWVRDEAFPEDWDFWARAMKAGYKFRYIDVDIYVKRDRPESEWNKMKHIDWKPLIKEHVGI
jgi:glycosyltransferase involved in cell wall biosynthesis